MADITLITAIIGVVSGSIGSILGVINIRHLHRFYHVQLKVIPKIAFMIDDKNVITFDRKTDRFIKLFNNHVPYRLCVQVTNLSTFPVTISDVGFGNIKETRGIICAPELTPGKTWPVRLETRESVMIYAAFGIKLDPKILSKAMAYAITDCGKVKYGTSPIFKNYITFLKKGSPISQ